MRLLHLRKRLGNTRHLPTGKILVNRHDEAAFNCINGIGTGELCIAIFLIRRQSPRIVAAGKDLPLLKPDRLRGELARTLTSLADRLLLGSLDDPVVLRYTSNVREIAYSRTALKALTRMPRNWAERIRDKIRIYADDPAALANNVKRLKSQDGLVRLRVGDWRVVMRDESVLQVLYVTSRSSTYRE